LCYAGDSPAASLILRDSDLHVAGMQRKSPATDAGMQAGKEPAKKGMVVMAEQVKRELNQEARKGGSLDIRSLILVAVLLAAGAVMKLTVGSFINFFGMKPNFIIAMYCLAILLIRPNMVQAGIIGLIAGAVCQLLPGTPYINFISEFLGALTMAALIRIPMKAGKVNFQTLAATFVSTVVSGGSFTICLFLFLGAAPSSLAAYVPIVLCTAVINCVLVQVLHIPLRRVLGNRGAATTASRA
jgi:hypothetical protein